MYYLVELSIFNCDFFCYGPNKHHSFSYRAKKSRFFSSIDKKIIFVRSIAKKVTIFLHLNVEQLESRNYFRPIALKIMIMRGESRNIFMRGESFALPPHPPPWADVCLEVFGRFFEVLLQFV